MDDEEIRKRQEIGERLLMVRKAAGETQQQCAEKIGCRNYDVSDYEGGRRKIPDTIWKKIVSVYNVDEDWLYEGIGEMKYPGPSHNDAEKTPDTAIQQNPAHSEKPVTESTATTAESTATFMSEVVIVRYQMRITISEKEQDVIAEYQNGKFQKVILNKRISTMDRNDWRALGLISRKLDEIDAIQ